MPLLQLVGVAQIVWGVPLPEAHTEEHDAFWQAVTLSAQLWQLDVRSPWQVLWQVVSPVAQAQKQLK
jgi:hypothetical protein